MIYESRSILSKVPIDCFYDANHVDVGEINVEKYPFHLVIKEKVNFDAEQSVHYPLQY